MGEGSLLGYHFSAFVLSGMDRHINTPRQEKASTSKVHRGTDAAPTKKQFSSIFERGTEPLARH